MRLGLKGEKKSASLDSGGLHWDSVQSAEKCRVECSYDKTDEAELWMSGDIEMVTR